MNSTQRDLLILILVTVGLFAAIYGWISYNGEPKKDLKVQEHSLFGEEFEERLAASFEERLFFIENDYTREFEKALNRRFASHLKDTSGLKSINIIEGDQINAFTTVGDRIYLFKGLITQIDDPQLVAAVVAHELGHIHHNHVEERLKLDIGISLLMSIISGGNQGMILELGRTMMGLSYNRSQEEEADEFARNLLEQAGIHPQHLSQAFLRMKTLSHNNSPPAFLSSHPSLDERIERILEHEVPDDFVDRPLRFPWQEFVQSL